MPSAYLSFFATSTQASAALIGLLFVSVSLAPRRVFGSAATAEHEMLALSAFTALVNAFFLSFTAQMPNPSVGTAAIVLSVLALSETLGLLFLLPRWRKERRVLRAIVIFVVSATAYGLELALGIALTRNPADLNALGDLLDIVIAAFAIGLLRAWQLLGAQRTTGLAGKLWLVIRRGGEPDTGSAEPSFRDSEAPSEPGS